MLLGVNPTQTWTWMDSELAQAYKLYEEALCGCGCGFPSRIAHDPELDGWVEANDETVCYVRKALDLWRAEHKEESEPGVLVGVEDTRPPELILNGCIPNNI